MFEDPIQDAGTNSAAADPQPETQSTSTAEPSTDPLNGSAGQTEKSEPQQSEPVSSAAEPASLDEQNLANQAAAQQQDEVEATVDNPAAFPQKDDLQKEDLTDTKIREVRDDLRARAAAQQQGSATIEDPAGLGGETLKGEGYQPAEQTEKEKKAQEFYKRFPSFHDYHEWLMGILAHHGINGPSIAAAAEKVEEAVGEAVGEAFENRQ